MSKLITDIMKNLNIILLFLLSILGNSVALAEDIVKPSVDGCFKYVLEEGYLKKEYSLRSDCQLLHKENETADNHYIQGISYYKKGSYSNALKTLREAAEFGSELATYQIGLHTLMVEVLAKIFLKRLSGSKMLL